MRLEIRVDSTVLKEIEDQISGSEGQSRVMTALRAGAFLVQSTAQRKILSGPKSGRFYKSGKKGTHRASAPGEAPANDTGTLVRGINIQPGDEPLSYDVNSLADYAGYLENGTSKMAPRPYLMPSARESADKIAELIADALRVG
jgi:hypothetical protein